MNFFNDIFHAIYGSEAIPGNVIGSLIQFLFGAGVVFGIELAARDKLSSRSPENFDLKFFLRDNGWRFFYTFLIGNIVVISGATAIVASGLDHLPESVSKNIPPFILAGLLADVIAMKIKWLTKPKSSNENVTQTTDAHSGDN